MCHLTEGCDGTKFKRTEENDYGPYTHITMECMECGATYKARKPAI